MAIIIGVADEVLERADAARHRRHDGMEGELQIVAQRRHQRFDGADRIGGPRSRRAGIRGLPRRAPPPPPPPPHDPDPHPPPPPPPPPPNRLPPARQPQ